jgi:O-antigen ligase
MRIFTIRKAVTAFLVILVLFGTFAYYYGKRYTDVDINHAQTEAQRNAIYRRELVRTYMPIIKQRPAFGWGITTLPALNGQASIDNEYLLLAATQGLTGLGLFLLILAGSGVRLFRLGSRNTGLEDKALVFAHMTVLMGLSAALATVFLGEQALMLLFLVVGWIHGMDPVGYEAQVAETKSFSFRKVLV